MQSGARLLGSALMDLQTLEGQRGRLRVRSGPQRGLEARIADALSEAQLSQANGGQPARVFREFRLVDKGQLVAARVRGDLPDG